MLPYHSIPFLIHEHACIKRRKTDYPLQVPIVTVCVRGTGLGLRLGLGLGSGLRILGRVRSIDGSWLGLWSVRAMLRFRVRVGVKEVGVSRFLFCFFPNEGERQALHHPFYTILYDPS
jgi:hypothetical protein